MGWVPCGTVYQITHHHIAEDSNLGDDYIAFIMKYNKSCRVLVPVTLTFLLCDLCIMKQNIYTQNYWVFGLSPSSGILGTRKHDVSETGCVSVLRCVGGGGTPTQLGPLGRANLNHWMRLAPPHLRTDTEPVT
jgi:hypothetical protein